MSFQIWVSRLLISFRISSAVFRAQRGLPSAKGRNRGVADADRPCSGPEQGCASATLAKSPHASQVSREIPLKTSIIDVSQYDDCRRRNFARRCIEDDSAIWLFSSRRLPPGVPREANPKEGHLADNSRRYCFARRPSPEVPREDNPEETTLRDKFGRGASAKRLKS